MSTIVVDNKRLFVWGRSFQKLLRVTKEALEMAPFLLTNIVDMHLTIV